MTRRHGLMTLIAAMAIAVGFTGLAAAHEGHAHKVMGTITMTAADHIMVKTSDTKTKADKVVPIVVNDKTKVLKGTAPATLKDVTEGARVVVDVGAGKEPLTAREIRLGASGSEATKTKTAAPHKHS